jgi:hypothetical protein
MSKGKSAAEQVPVGGKPDGKHRRRIEGGQVDMEDDIAAVEESEIVPLAWRMSQMESEGRMMKSMKNMFEEMIGKTTVRWEAKADELKDEMQDVKAKCEAQAVAMSDAQEAIRALKGEVTKLKKENGTSSRGEGKGYGGQTTQISGAHDSGEGHQNVDRKTREMVISGFSWNTPRVEIEAVIKDVMIAAKVEYEDVFSPRAMNTFGIVRFENTVKMDEFKKWIGRLNRQPEFGGIKLRMRENGESKEERIQGRAVAKVKRALMEVNAGRTDVTADRKAGMVWVGRTRVAKWNGEEMKLAGEALTLEVRIKELIAEKRAREDDLSE